MNSDAALELARRLIGRDQAIRASGKTPPWGSVRQILDLVYQQNLLSDSVVSVWLCALAGGADHWLMRRLLEVVGALLDRQYTDQAHALYRLILGLDDETRWAMVAPALVSESVIVEEAIDPVLGRCGLLACHPRSWGRTACELLGRVIREHQKEDWHDRLKFLALHAEQSGEPFNVDQPFKPKKDDWPTLWYFSPSRLPTPRAWLAAAVERGVRDAAQLPEPETFQLFAGWLLEQGFSVGAGILLAALLDGLIGKLAAKSWHAAEASRLLALDQVQVPSLQGLRRLLRRAIPRPDAAVAVRLTEVIRSGKFGDSTYMCELWDIASWGTLTPEEEAYLAELSGRGEFAPPSDPRDEPTVCCIGPTWLPPDAEHKWPYAEDTWAVEEFLAMHGNQDPQQNQTNDHARLAHRLEALKTLLRRDVRDAEAWLGEILGWCKECLLLLRREELARLGRNSKEGILSAEEWEVLLSSRAPWWGERVEAALSALARDVPGYHRERRPGGLFWGTSDPIFQSLAYLDEVLAVDGEGPFAALRARMEKVIDAVWPAWPAFTRATALSVLRPWYWHRLALLRNRLTDLVTQEHDPLVLHYGVDRLLVIGGPDFGANLGWYLDRAPQIESSGQTVNQVGRAIGRAYLFGQGQAKLGEEVRQLSELCLRLQQSPPNHRPTREQLIRGLLFGALDLLNNKQFRVQPVADAWVALVGWACSSWPWNDGTGGEPDRFPVSAITVALGHAWPEGLLRRVLLGLQESFLRIISDGTLGDFCSLHMELQMLLQHEGQGRTSQMAPLEQGSFSDEHLIQLCRASADHVASWQQSSKTTKDLAWGSARTGHETADLIRAVIGAGSDRNYLRRELPPIIDRLAEFGAPGVVTGLRLLLRRS